jgi:hypothetical protein
MEYIFDTASAIRERLFLLSVLKDAHDSANWAYSPRYDAWHHVGGDTLRVHYEASRSLDLLAERGIDRKTAMAMIGYPENP